MQAVEDRCNSTLLCLAGQACAQRFTRHAGHDNQRLVRAQIRPDGPRIKSRRRACKQFQCPPLAQRLVAVESPLIVSDR